MAETDTIERPDTRRVQVANLPPADSGRGFARLPDKIMDELGLKEGDVIEIVGKRSTAARALRPYGEDEGIAIIRLDGLQRANAGVGSGDFVEIRKVQSKPATRVTFAPAQDNIRLQGSTEALKRSFAGRPLTEGDVVATAGHQRVNADMPDNVRQMLNAPAFALQEIRLVAATTTPKGIVHIDAKTVVELLPEYTKKDGERRADVTYDDLGGMRDTIDALREMVELPLAAPRIVPASRRRPAQGRLAARPARNRQDPAGARGRQRERSALLPHRRAGNHGLGLWREREAPARNLRAGRPSRAVDHLHRRDRFDRAQARPGHRRGGEAPGRPAPDADGRPRAAPEFGGDRRDQPSRGLGRGAAPARPVRPRNRRRRARREGTPRNPRNPHARNAARRAGSIWMRWRAAPTASSAPIWRR